MALLTDDIQDKLIELLVNEGLIEKSVIDDALKRASESGKPLFSLLSEEGLLDNELLVHGVAQVRVCRMSICRIALLVRIFYLYYRPMLLRDLWLCR